MSKINAMMDMGKRAMMNSQTALQTVSHNIANKTTEGYSRQRVELQANAPVQEGRLQMGQGARAAAVTRTNNPYLEKQIQKEKGQLGFAEARADGLSRVEQVFNEQANKGLNQYLTDFFNGFRELSNNPESITSRTMVKEAAEALVNDFKRVQTQLSQIQGDINETIKNRLQEINKISKEIGTLNESIAQVEVQGIPANDQRDRRDLLLKELNEKIDISYAENKNGLVTVSTAGNAILVSGYDTYELQNYRDPNTGHIEIYYKPNESTPPFNITDRIKGGSLGGALAVRDGDIADLKRGVDELAIAVSQEVNAAHTRGFDRTGKQGVEFFKIPSFVEGAAMSLEVNSQITQDVQKIAAAARPGAVGDNTVANIISNLQFKEVMDNGSATLDDYYNSQVGKVGVLAQRAIKTKEAQDNIVSQLSTIRESVSGVSLDEETTKMIEFQRAFDASARVIRTADEMFDTVLNLKRL